MAQRTALAPINSNTANGRLSLASSTMGKPARKSIGPPKVTNNVQVGGPGPRLSLAASTNSQRKQSIGSNPRLSVASRQSGIGVKRFDLVTMMIINLRELEETQVRCLEQARSPKTQDQYQIKVLWEVVSRLSLHI